MRYRFEPSVPKTDYHKPGYVYTVYLRLPLPAPVGHILNLSSCFFLVYALSTTVNWLQQVGFFLSSSCLRRSLIKILFYSCGSQQVATKTNDIVTKTHYHNFHFFFYSPTTDVVTSAKKWFSSLNFSPRKLSGGVKSSIAWLWTIFQDHFATTTHEN